MILPYPHNLNISNKHTLTFTLVFLNVFIFVMCFWGRGGVNFEQDLFREENVKITAKVYYEYLKGLSAEELFRLPEWLHKIKDNDKTQVDVLALYALRDKEFLARSSRLNIDGDQVAIANWKHMVEKFKKDYFSQIVFVLGLSSFEQSPLAWLTYQFSHSGWIHLLSNLVFLIFIAAAIEEIMGSMALVVVYLLGGIFGGFLFLIINQHGAIPMVGASASLSALLTFYVFVEPRKRVRFIYFLSPFEGQNGFIYLPTVLIIPLYLVVDFANLFSTPEGFGTGVAYSAHIGGTLCGAWLGLVSRYVFTTPENDIPKKLQIQK